MNYRLRWATSRAVRLQNGLAAHRDRRWLFARIHRQASDQRSLGARREAQTKPVLADNTGNFPLQCPPGSSPGPPTLPRRQRPHGASRAEHPARVGHRRGVHTPEWAERPTSR